MENTTEKTALEITTENLQAMFKDSGISCIIDGANVTLSINGNSVDLRIPKERDGRYTADDIEQAFDRFLASGYDTSIAGYKEFCEYIKSEKVTLDGVEYDNPDFDAEAKLPSSAYINGFAGLSFKDHLTMARKRASQRILAAKIAAKNAGS